MRYSLILAMLSFLSPAFAQEQVHFMPLKVQATCDKNPECIVPDNYPVMINVQVINESDDALECAFSLVEKMGPRTTIRDANTGRTVKFPMSLPPRKTDVKLTKLQVGEVWTTYVIIYPGERRSLGKGITGFDAHIAVQVSGRNPQTGEPSECSGDTTLRINTSRG